MKTLMLIVAAIIGITSAIAFAQQPAANADAFYRQGMQAEHAGDPDAARTAYEQALRINPRHADATFRLGQLRINRDRIARKGRQAAFNGVMLAEIKLEDAALRETLESLSKMVEARSEGEVAPNFVIQDADAKLADVRISLQLRNVTAGAVLDYVLGMANARARHDEFAIVILPN